METENIRSDSSDEKSPKKLDDQTKVKKRMSRNLEANHNNGLIYLVLKEGFRITLKRTKHAKYTNQFYKCFSLKKSTCGIDEEIDENGIQTLGREFNEIVKNKINSSPNGQYGEITLTMKDLFDDGSGVITNNNE